MQNVKNNISPLRLWVLKNKYFIKVSETKEIKSMATHYLLDGGLWKIPLEKYQEFLLLLANDLQNGCKYYISENRTEVFRLICDLDFYEEFTITTVQIERIVKIMQEVINEYYQDITVIICGTDTKTVTINDAEYIKSGFHLVWPKIFLTVEKAKELRLLFINKLNDIFGQRSLHNSWENVIDLAVYTDNGLRMLGSRKMVPCKNKDSSCEKCNGTGRVDEGRVYKPLSILSGVSGNEEYLRKMQNDYYLMLLETCICNYSNLPETGLLKDLIISPINKIKNVKSVKRDETELSKKIEAFIRKKFQANYSNVSVKKVTKVDNNTYFVEVNDNFCMNVNRQHTSSSIYFQIKPSGICQRCFCKKETTDGRSSGMCSRFSSNEIQLTQVFSKFLYNDVITKKNKKFVNVSLTKDDCLTNCKNILNQLKNDLLKK